MKELGWNSVITCLFTRQEGPLIKKSFLDGQKKILERSRGKKKKDREVPLSIFCRASCQRSFWHNTDRAESVFEQYEYGGLV